MKDKHQIKKKTKKTVQMKREGEKEGHNYMVWILGWGKIVVKHIINICFTLINI